MSTTVVIVRKISRIKCYATYAMRRTTNNDKRHIEENLRGKPIKIMWEAWSSDWSRHQLTFFWHEWYRRRRVQVEAEGHGLKGAIDATREMARRTQLPRLLHPFLVFESPPFRRYLTRGDYITEEETREKALHILFSWELRFLWGSWHLTLTILTFTLLFAFAFRFRFSKSTIHWILSALLSFVKPVPEKKFKISQFVRNMEQE